MSAINVFVSTQETQGQRKNDFCFVPDGEVVTFPYSVCTNQEADDDCGCARALCGVSTAQATTTAKVALLEGGEEELLFLLRRSLEESGWGDLMTAEERQRHIEQMADRLTREATRFTVGDVVEYRNGVFSRREQFLWSEVQ